MLYYLTTMFYKRKPTIKQINHYLKPVIEQLLQKHKKVTNPDFEEELRQLTGIGWKQAKNYRNHPNPSLKVRENSKIQLFIAQKHSKDIAYKLKRYFVYSSIAILCLSITATALLGISTAINSPQQSLQQLIDDRIEQQLIKPSLRNCKKRSKEKIECPEGNYYFRSY